MTLCSGMRMSEPKLVYTTRVQVWAPERNVPCTGCGVEFPALTFPIYIGHRKRQPDHGKVEFHLCPRCLRLLAEQTRDALAEFQRGIE